MTFAIFHDFQILENGIPKFHDIPWLSTTRGHPAFMTSGQETERVCSYNPGARIGASS